MRDAFLDGLGYRCVERVLLDGNWVSLKVAANRRGDVFSGWFRGGRDAFDLLVELSLLRLHAGNRFRGGLCQGVRTADTLLHVRESRG